MPEVIPLITEIPKHYGFEGTSPLSIAVAKCMLRHDESDWYFKNMTDGVTIYGVLIIPDEGLKIVVEEIVAVLHAKEREWARINATWILTRGWDWRKDESCQLTFTKEEIAELRKGVG